jgi:NAD(P)-dependent dehydrogenase (short-subunit alcohol dehydrogenase family)
VCTIDQPVTFGDAPCYATVALKRGASPAEIADTVVFVASGKAAYIRGQIIRVNGGKTVSRSCASAVLRKENPIMQSL